MNKKDLERIRKELVMDRDELLAEFEKIKKREESFKSNEVGDEIDKASENVQKEILFFFNDHDRIKYDAIEDAIQKIDEGRYGSCEKCGRDISKPRLEAIPHARFCIRCKQPKGE